jgi:hypothetical protein
MSATKRATTNVTLHDDGIDSGGITRNITRDLFVSELLTNPTNRSIHWFDLLKVLALPSPLHEHVQVLSDQYCHLI